MEYWKDPKEVVTAVVKMFEECAKDPELLGGLKKVDQLILFDYTESGPDCSIWIDCRNKDFKVGGGKPTENPDLTMSLSADDAHRSWSNKLNPVMAITRKKIRVKGSATGLLKLAPKLKKVAVIYNKVLKDIGLESIVLK